MSRRHYYGIGPAEANPSMIGQYNAAEGGWLIGFMKYPNDGVYALYLADKSVEITDYYVTSSSIDWRTASTLDGLTNTNDCVAKSGNNSRVARYCYNLVHAGKSDWYLPANEEWMLIFRTFKPGTATPNAYAGATPNSVPPHLRHGLEPITQTPYLDFRTGGPQAFDTVSAYWTSTSGGSSENTQSIVYSDTLALTIATATSQGLGRRARPIRRVLYQNNAKQVILGTQWAGGNIDWTVPEGVTSVSVLCVGCGASGLRANDSPDGTITTPGVAGGLEGEMRYMNNISVTPGQVINCHVSRNAGTPTSFGSIFSSATGGTAITPRAQAGTGSGGGARIGGTGGGGTSGINLITPTTSRTVLSNGSGGGSGATPYGGKGGDGQWPGGGGGGGGGAGATTSTGYTPPGGWGGAGAGGAIRIIWPGDTRGYPSTNTEDQT